MTHPAAPSRHAVAAGAARHRFRRAARGGRAATSRLGDGVTGRARGRGVGSGWLVAAVLASVSCGGAARFDSASLATPERSFAVVAPAPVIESALPRFTPCPPGWREALLGAVTVCEPWPAAGVERCAGASAHLPGRPGCEPVGSACPPGDFPASSPSGPALFVKAGAVGGNGTPASPFGALDDALARSAPGTTVVVARGRYAAAGSLPAGITVEGVCASDTVIGPARPDTPLLQTRAEGVVVQNVTVRGDFVGALVQGGQLTLRDVVFDSTVGVGLSVAGGADVTLERVVIRDTRPFPNATGGRGLQVSQASVTGRQVVLERNLDFALVISGASARVELEAAVVRDTRPLAEQNGVGVNVVSGARLELASSVVEQSVSYGLRLLSGASATLTDVLVRDTQPLARPLPSGERTGYGVWLQNGRLTGTRVRVERNAHAGVLTYGDDPAAVSLTDALVRDTAWSDGAANGLFADRGASLALERVLVRGCRPTGVLASARATLALTDVTVLETGADDRGFGAGAVVSSGARVTAQRVLVDGSRGLGLVVVGAPGQRARLVDVSVSNTRADVSGQSVALALGEGVEASLERVRVSSTGSLALVVTDPGTRVTLADVAIDDVGRLEPGARSGYGLVARSGATLSGERVSVRATTRAGVYALEEGTSVALTELAVVQVDAPACSGACAATVGVLATTGARVAARRFRVSWSPGYGVLVGDGAAIDLVDGEVSHHLVGAGVQQADFDVRRLDQGVVFRDNTRKLDSATVPLPEPPLPLRR